MSKFEQRQMIQWARDVHTAAGMTPTEAQVMEMARAGASAFVTTRLVPWTEVHDVGHFAYEVQPLDAAQMLDRFDDLLMRARTAYASHRLVQSGQDRSMFNSYYNPAVGDHERLLAEFRSTTAVIWANDVRKEAGLDGPVSATDVQKALASSGGGCASVALTTAVALVAARVAATSPQRTRSRWGGGR